MKFALQIESEGEALTEDTETEVVRLLRQTATRIAQHDHQGDTGVLLDVNGNRVGSWVLER